MIDTLKKSDEKKIRKLFPSHIEKSATKETIKVSKNIQYVLERNRKYKNYN